MRWLKKSATIEPVDTFAVDADAFRDPRTHGGQEVIGGAGAERGDPIVVPRRQLDARFRGDAQGLVGSIALIEKVLREQLHVPDAGAQRVSNDGAHVHVHDGRHDADLEPLAQKVVRHGDGENVHAHRSLGRVVDLFSCLQEPAPPDDLPERSNPAALQPEHDGRVGVDRWALRENLPRRAEHDRRYQREPVQPPDEGNPWPPVIERAGRSRRRPHPTKPEPPVRRSTTAVPGLRRG